MRQVMIEVDATSAAAVRAQIERLAAGRPIRLPASQRLSPT